LFFVCAGEEISWGQRLIGWQTPEWLASENAQGETNLHNLWFLQAHGPDKERKSFVELLINPNRLLSIFWLSYCLILPLLATTTTGHRLVSWSGIPVPPLGVGLLFLITYVVFHAMVAFGGGRAYVHQMDELKEAIQATCFALLALTLAFSSTREEPSS
jgi:hypothetical protein